jgi:transposase
MLTVDKKEAIRREHFLQKKSIRRIARELGYSRRTVRKALQDSDVPVYRRTAPTRYPVLQSVIPLIDNWLKEDESQPKKQRHTARRIWIRLKGEHGFTGGESTVRRYVHEKRLVVPEVFVPLIYQPGSDAQADWGEAKVIVDGEATIAQFFVLRLCYSGACLVVAYPNQKQEAFFDGHQQNFEFLGGVPQRIIYDNLTTAVKKVLSGRNRQEQDSFTAFRSHFLFESVFCQLAKGNEKGGVENIIGYVRRNFFVPVPKVSSFAELNQILHQKCLDNLNRIPAGKQKSIGQLLQEEKGCFLPLPKHSFDCCRTVPVNADSCSRIQFETNKYSVPTDFAYQTLSCKAYPFQIKIVQQEKMIAEHRRCYGRYQEILNPVHYLKVLERKPGAFLQAKPLSGWQLPEVFEKFYAGLKERRPEKATREYIRTLRLLEEFSLGDVTAAIEKSLSLKIYQPDALRLFLIEKRIGTPPSFQKLEVASLFPYLAKYQVQMAQPVSYNQLLGREGK